jgi:hypothetical protein
MFAIWSGRDFGLKNSGMTAPGASSTRNRYGNKLKQPSSRLEPAFGGRRAVLNTLHFGYTIGRAAKVGGGSRARLAEIAGVGSPLCPANTSLT